MLHVLTVFLSAFLLFQIQPMISKFVLPWFGGTPAVWSASLLLFQVLLVAGYSYAHWLSRCASPKRHAIIHLAVVGSSVLLLLAASCFWQPPILPDPAWISAGDQSPTTGVLKLLALAVGGPYFVLSTTSPLVQWWYAQDHPQRSPYLLYAYSNVGSLLALVTYPLIIEPALPLKVQATVWCVAYLLLATAVAYASLRRLRDVAPIIDTHRVFGEPSQNAAPQPTAPMHFLWASLAACASIQLLATTSHISQEVAVIPFLWILPLLLYLLSFIVCFSHDRWYSRNWYAGALVLVSALFCWTMARPVTLNIGFQIGAHSLVLFVCCMICHGELAHLRPHSRHLTSYYLMISVGGALGGVFVTLIAPRIFNGFWELHLGLIGCWALLLIALGVSRHRSQIGQRLTLVWTGLSTSALLFLGIYFAAYVESLAQRTLAAERNFFGVLRVCVADTTQRANILMHGATVHGIQFLAETQHRRPTAYYTIDSGVGLAVLHHPKRAAGMRIGMVGLGIGTMAAYGTDVDVIRIYEIDPEVIRLAQGRGDHFSYLRNCRARVKIVQGDGRIRLNQELHAGERQNFDLFVLDAFSSDSVPVHLLTKEAFDLYLQHLAPEGIIAVHITNRHLDLRPVLWELTQHFGLRAGLVRTETNANGAFPSTWVLAGRAPDFFQQPEIACRLSELEPARRIRLWSDDYSNLLQILK